MTQMIIAKDDTLTEELVASLIGKCIHAPTNVHEIQTPTGATTKANVWFAGIVAGYEKAVIGFNYQADEFHEEPQTLSVLSVMNNGHEKLCLRYRCKDVYITITFGTRRTD
ncbi:hypothetical protein [Paenibacillus sp. BIC5C1]|uniref:hypothetical protein n=1 Tax=Paenibacillus sp. BIC5C1 TaxID=3078263 RepID=UPI0028EFF351|nr:hypothetical protein [Paenibacillus sp. BIC5C1]